eukprot:TRINITY_DN3544_c0_g1_i2.p1 TRINITY_DN3544_c0_g1~~TRINITY_DN3544_c0_g1_i2.p1  ORF type:complete len:370 (+),score=3.02 TRINITY_DN3544_c0_g1_i2:130-1239(+)
MLCNHYVLSTEYLYQRLPTTFTLFRHPIKNKYICTCKVKREVESSRTQLYKMERVYGNSCDNDYEEQEYCRTYQVYNDVQFSEDGIIDYQEILKKIQKNPTLSNQYYDNVQIYNLTQGVKIYLVEKRREIEVAIDALKASMTDNVLAIDFEWKPDRRIYDNHKISLIQIASAKVCVLLRICKMGNELPQQVEDLVTQEDVVVLGSCMRRADNSKMKLTFGEDLTLFRNYIDVQDVFQVLGYKRPSPKNICKVLFEFDIGDEAVSDWETNQLTRKQITYAGIDTLLIQYVIRELKRRQLQCSQCFLCCRDFGVLVMEDRYLQCKSCDTKFSTYGGLYYHCHQKKHKCYLNLSPEPTCTSCGRWKFKTKCK